jgi:hypothetical protein
VRFALLATIAVLCSSAWAVLEVEQASAHNLALSPSLLGAKNACGSPQRAATEANIFTVADARIVSIIPSVGNTSSDLAGPALLWSWSASFPLEASFPVPSGVHCPAGSIRYFSPSSPSFSGELSYSYGNFSGSWPLSSASPNPVLLNLSEGKLSGESFATPFVPLPISLAGTISLTYQFLKSSYSYSCVEADGYIGCGCEMQSESGARTFSTPVFHSRNFSVEAGPVEMLWLNPPLSSRLEGNGTGKISFFARRMPANISFSFAGTHLGFARPYSFSLHPGNCGELVAERELSLSGSVFLNSSEPIFPSQLVGQNASYVPFYAEFAWQARAGKGEFSTIFEDAFSHAETFSKNFSVRAPLQLSGSAGRPGAIEPFSGTAARSSGAMEQVAAGDGMTTAAMVAPEKQSAFPDFAVLAVAFALPLAIGAAALCRRLEWL